MIRNLLILLLFPLLVQGQYEIKPSVLPMFRNVYVPLATVVDSTAFDRYVATLTFRLGPTGVTIAEIDTSDVATLTDTIRFYITGSDQPSPTTVLNANIDTSLQVGGGVVWDSIVLVGGEIFWYSGGRGKNISEVIYTEPDSADLMTLNSPDKDSLGFEVTLFLSTVNGTTPDSVMIRWDTIPNGFPASITDGNLAYLGDTTDVFDTIFIDMPDDDTVFVSVFTKNDGPLGIGTWTTNPNQGYQLVDSTGEGASPRLDSLHAYYDFDESSGDLLDLHNSYDGTNHGCEYDSVGIIGTSWGFVTANSDYVDFGANYDLIRNDTLISVSCWIRTHDVGTSHTMFGGNTTGSFIFRQNTTSLQMIVRGVGTIGSSTGVTIAVNTWYHCVGTYDGTSGDYAFYVNGVARGSGTAKFALSNNIVYLSRYGTSNEFDGVIDEMAVYRGYLIDLTRAQYLYNSGSAKAYPFD